MLINIIIAKNTKEEQNKIKNVSKVQHV